MLLSTKMAPSITRLQMVYVQRVIDHWRKGRLSSHLRTWTLSTFDYCHPAANYRLQHLVREVMRDLPMVDRLRLYNVGLYQCLLLIKATLRGMTRSPH